MPYHSDNCEHLYILILFSFQIRDDEYDWPNPYDIRNIRNNGPDIEALDNLEPYQTDDLENGEVCIIFISNIPDRSQL